MRYTLLLILSFVLFSESHAQEQTPKIVRTVTYKAVQKDTIWTTGPVVERIRFIKFNKKGLKVIENLLNPNASTQSKTVYFYDDGNRLIERANYSGVRDAWQILAYEYDDKGRVIQVTEKDINRKDRYVTAVSYDDQDRVIQRVVENIGDKRSTTYDIVYAQGNDKSKVIVTSTTAKQFVNDFQEKDTISLVPRVVVTAEEYLREPKRKNAVFEYDENSNWVKMTVSENGTPETITLRDIEYYGERTDLDDMLLRGRVKSFEQIAYVPIPTNSEVVYKGDKIGEPCKYRFDENGMKISKEMYSAAGTLIGKTEWEYDENGRIEKEIHKTSGNAIQSYDLWKYNRNGNVRSKIKHNAQGDMTRMGTFRYDLEYNCIQEVWQNPDATLYSDIRYEYNPYGQQVGVTPVVHKEEGDKLYSVKRFWNFRGRLLEEQFTKLPGVGRDLFTYKYSTKGELISGTEQFDGQPIVAYKYKFSNDDQGNWTIRIKYVDDVPVAYEERKYIYYK